jgi:hypothetical protein
MAETQPTFFSGARLLIGDESLAAWLAQSVRCNCGSYGDAEHAISGTSGTSDEMPAKWLGCKNCPGQALGYPLVYRTSGQIGKFFMRRRS